MDTPLNERSHEPIMKMKFVVFCVKLYVCAYISCHRDASARELAVGSFWKAGVFEFFFVCRENIPEMLHKDITDYGCDLKYAHSRLKF